MRSNGAILAGMVIMALAIGCRTPQPNLKPPQAAEALNTPPSERRYDTSVYPKEAFNNRDATKKFNADQEITAVKGPGMPGSIGPGSTGGR